METKVYMVTGVTSGLGKAIALELAKTGGTVIMVAHDMDRGKYVGDEIASATQNPKLDMQLCDLSNISSVRNLATVLNSRYNNIDVLINNAAVYKSRREISLDGFEKMFATNHLGPFLLTYMLLDRLLASGSARIINITAPSTVELNFDDLQSENRFNPMRTFGATKMANLLYTFELARRLENTGVTVNAFHPGLVRSSLMKEAFAPIRFLSWLLASPPKLAAQEVVRMATALEFETITGKFLRKGKEFEAAEYARDPANQQRLWQISETLTNAPEQGPNYDPTGSVEMFDKDKDAVHASLREDEPET